MFLGRRKATVATPIETPPPRAVDVATPDKLLELRRSAESPQAQQLERDIALLADELVWLKERFTKLQNRVTSELREIRRELDRGLEPEEDYDEGE